MDMALPEIERNLENAPAAWYEHYVADTHCSGPIRGPPSRRSLCVHGARRAGLQGFTSYRKPVSRLRASRNDQR